MFQPVILSLGAAYKVRNAAGRGLGKIEEIIVDQEDGCVHYSIVSPGGFLEFGNDLIAVPWRRLQMEYDQKSFLLNVDKETLKNAPRFDRDNWPDMTLREWREHVETYFAYNPDETQEAESGGFIESGANATSVEEKSADHRLARRVEFELFAARAFDMESVSVTSREGKVTLYGRVDSNAEAILAENTALVVYGVASVVNNLKVSKAA